MYKYIFLLLLVVAACQPISRGPNPYERSMVSPLYSVESPLYTRGQMPAPGELRVLIGPGDPSRVGTIPTDPYGMTTRSHLPILMHQPGFPCGASAMEHAMIAYLTDHPGQQRNNLHCDVTVMRVAQARAKDMIVREYYGHYDPDGWGANHYLGMAGCLPNWYPYNGNSVESITINYFTAEESLAAMLRSEPHRIHLLGLHPFFAEQDLIGVGWAESDWGGVFVVITAPECD